MGWVGTAVMTFQEAKAVRSAIEVKVAGLSALLGGFERGSFGLTPDAVKCSVCFKDAKASFAAAFAEQRAFNVFFITTFRRDIASERAARFGVSHGNS